MSRPMQVPGSNVMLCMLRAPFHLAHAGFVWREAPKPGITNGSSAVLKGGPPSTRIDARCVAAAQFLSKQSM